MSQKKAKNNFVVQGLILGVAAILVRVLGLLYQMPLTRIIGDMGNGYYSYAYNIYSMVLLISSFSIPIAVSKLVSARLEKRQFKNVQKVFKASMIYVMLISGVLALLTFIFAGRLLSESQQGAVPALRVLCPVIFLAGILGVFRGYFQGFNTMMPTSFSQILEGILNAVVSVLAAYLLVAPYAVGSSKRATFGALGSTLGTAAGVIIGLLFMWFVYSIYKPTIRKRVRHDRSRHQESYGDLFKLIVWTATPIILSSAIYNICPVVDQKLFASVLEAKKVVGDDITVLQGIYSAKYLKLISVPVSIASALSSAIIPAITINVVNRNLKEANHNIDIALRYTMLIAVPCTFGLAVLAEPIMLLFGRSTTLIVAVHVLIWGAISVVFNCISTVTNAVLQGLDNMRAPMIHSIIALVLHIVSVYVFLNLNFGIYALIIGTVVFSLAIWILNAISIWRITGYKKLFGSKMISITLASLGMAFLTFCVYHGLVLITGEGTEFIVMILALVVAVVSYLFFLFVANAFNEEDYELMPFGSKIKAIGLKIGMVETAEQPFEEELGEIYTEEEDAPAKKFIFRKQQEEEPTVADGELESNTDAQDQETSAVDTNEVYGDEFVEMVKQALREVDSEEEVQPDAQTYVQSQKDESSTTLEESSVVEVQPDLSETMDSTISPETQGITSNDPIDLDSLDTTNFNVHEILENIVETTHMDATEEEEEPSLEDTSEFSITLDAETMKDVNVLDLNNLAQEAETERELVDAQKIMDKIQKQADDAAKELAQAKSTFVNSDHKNE